MTDDTRKLIELARTREKEWASRESLPSDVLLIVELADALEASLPTEQTAEERLLHAIFEGESDRDALARIAKRVIDVEVKYDDDDWHRFADAALAEGFRRSPVPPEPTVDEWRSLIHAERATHAEKGYTPEHDREHGPEHLIDWAIDYARRGKTVEASAMMLALRELLAAVPPVTEETVTTVEELPVGTVFRAFYYPPSFGLPPENPHLAVVQLTRGHRIVHGERQEFPLDTKWERIDVLYRPVVPVPEGEER